MNDYNGLQVETIVNGLPERFVRTQRRARLFRKMVAQIETDVFSESLEQRQSCLKASRNCFAVFEESFLNKFPHLISQRESLSPS